MRARAPREPDADGWTPSGLWRAIDENGIMQAETSNVKDFEHLGLRRPGVTFEQQYVQTQTGWKEETP